MRNILVIASMVSFLLTFGARAQAPATQPAINPNLPTIWIAGDSTVGNGADLGWGSHLSQYFDPAKVNVVNRARANSTSRTFTTEGLWEQIRSQIKIDDFTLIQFGHNDGGPVDAAPFQGSLPGTGDETQVVTRNGQKETIHTFGWYLRRMVLETTGNSSMPILMSMTVRNEWLNGKIERGFGPHGKWSQELADEQGSQFIDATNIIADEYEKLGREKVATFFPTDNIHTNAEGAELNASLIVAGLKGLPSHPIDAFLSEKGKAIPANKKYLPK